MAASNYMLLAVACAGLWSQALGVDSTERQRSRIVKEILEQRYLTFPDGPAGNESAPVVVTIGFTIISITDIDVSKGVLELTAYLTFSWYDARVMAAFDTSCDEDVSLVTVPADGIWTPDIELYQMAAPGMQILNRNNLAAIFKNGYVHWIPYVSMSVPCVIDRSSPFNCTLKFGSWAHNGFQLDLAVASAEGDISSFQPTNPRWALNGRPTLTRDFQKYPCCPESYPNVMVTVPLRRRRSS